MRPIQFSMTLVQRHALQRPAGYLDDLFACALARDDRTLTLDADSPCYRALLAKYRPAPRGLGDTLARVIHAATLGKVKPCSACESRRRKLNERFKYG